MKCATHTEIDTNITCGKCGIPICPKCMVQTPVGARCTTCAKLAKVPTYRVNRWYYLRAVGIGLAAAIVCGIIWGFIAKITFFYINLLLSPIAAFAIAEAISFSVNRKRGTGLAIVGAIEVIICYLVSIFFLRTPLFHSLDALALALSIFVSVTHLR